MKISFSNILLPKNGTIAVSVFKDGVLSSSAKEIDRLSKKMVARAIAASRFIGKSGEILEIPAPSGIDAQRLILFGLGEKKELTLRDLENAGGALLKRSNANGEKIITVIVDDISITKFSDAEATAHLGYGAKLADYRFEKFKSKKDNDKAPTLAKFSVASTVSTAARKLYADMEAIAEGVFLTRDLVSEPANSLFPEKFAAECKELKKLGVKVEILNEAKMAKLGMGALLGVGQGSRRESQMVIMQWNGGSKVKSEKPLAFVGKGVCFDTGGISLKPAGGMEEMKWDMGGAGAVTGLMKALAGRKAKVNAVGVIGLVENMPDGNAQRPGDIVTSMSGQTIEVLNTDAEGRLVLADALWYTQDRFKPQFMIDLATLTGAIIIALGHENAGLFSNSDTLSDQLSEAGKVEGEGVWRFPMSDTYAKQTESPIADLQNIGTGGRGAGSIVAAEFLKKFVNEVPWVHLDIAGMAWSKKDTPTVPKGGTGYGVRLLDRFVRDNYEK
jgi:leucyl aminopeptidase